MKTNPTYKRSQLPDVKFHPGTPERLMEAVALLIVIANWAYVVYMRIANGNEHFADGCICAGTTTFSFIVVALCAYAPIKLINFPFSLRPDNIVTQYVLSVRFIRIVNILICLCTTATTLAVYHDWAMPLVYVAVGIPIAATIAYIVIAYRHR